MKDPDEEYADLLKTERAVRRQKKQQHYRILKIECCDTCENTVYEYEGEMQCSLLLREKWNVIDALVGPIAVCDKYEKRRRIPHA